MQSVKFNYSPTPTTLVVMFQNIDINTDVTQEYDIKEIKADGYKTISGFVDNVVHNAPDNLHYIRFEKI